MVKKSDLKKLNAIMQEGNDFKNENKYNKALEKYFEALNFVESRVKDPNEKQDELSSIKSQIDQVYSIEIIDIVDKAKKSMDKGDFKQAFKALDEGMRLADKIEDIDMRNYEIEEISYLSAKFKIDMSLDKALKLRDLGKVKEALRSMKEVLVNAEQFHQDDVNNYHLRQIKTTINETYSLLIKDLLEKANQFETRNQLENAFKMYEDALKIADDMFESDFKISEISNLKDLINKIHSDMIKPLVEEGNSLVKENNFDTASQKFEKALEIANKMYQTPQKEAEIKSINNFASQVLNPVYLERMKPIIDKGKELIIKEFYEDDINIVNEAINKFSKALEIAEGMATSDEKVAKVNEIKQLINKTCRARINLLKDRSLQKIAQREFDKAVNELYAAMSVAKKMPVPEEENEDYNDLKQAVNDVYNSQVEEVLKKGNSELIEKNYDKAIETFNNALKMTDKMYLTEEMENEVNKIKGLIYQAELKGLVGRGDLIEEQKKFERELERLNKKMEYAKTIDDPERRFAEMEEIKTSIDEVHNSEIELLVEQGKQLAETREFDKSFNHFERALKIHERIESPEFKNKIPIKYHYKTELINKAKLEIADKIYEQAIKDCEKAIELDSTFIDAFYYIGIANISKGNYDEAITSFKKSIGLKNDHSESWNQVGYANERKYDYEEAKKAYMRAIEINPNFAEAHFNLGNILKNANQHNEAIISYQKATELDPTLTLAWLFLASEYIRKKDYEKSITSIESALNLDSGLNNFYKPAIEQIKSIIKDLDDKLHEKFIHRNDQLV
jgi:tetratricopeptide (TPR) repeat protein